MTTARTKFITDTADCPTNPANETEARQVVEDVIAEVFNNLNAGKSEQSDFNNHKTSSDHDGRYYTETELNNGQLDTRYYTESEVNALLSAIAVGGLAPDSITDTYLKQTGNNILPNFNIHLADSLPHSGTSIARFKTGSSTYTDNDTSQTFTDAFCTTTSLVVISITGTTPQGTWSVTSGAGSFTITSTVAESADVTFDYYITKVV